MIQEFSCFWPPDSLPSPTAGDCASKWVGAFLLARVNPPQQLTLFLPWYAHKPFSALIGAYERIRYFPFAGQELKF